MIKVANADWAKPRGMISSTLAETPLSDSAVLQDISATAKPMVTVLRVNNKYVCLPIEPMARLIAYGRVNLSSLRFAMAIFGLAAQMMTKASLSSKPKLLNI